MLLKKHVAPCLGMIRMPRMILNDLEFSVQSVAPWRQNCFWFLLFFRLTIRYSNMAMGNLHLLFIVDFPIKTCIYCLRTFPSQSCLYMFVMFENTVTGISTSAQWWTWYWWNGAMGSDLVGKHRWQRSTFQSQSNLFMFPDHVVQANSLSSPSVLFLGPGQSRHACPFQSRMNFLISGQSKSLRGCVWDDWIRNQMPALAKQTGSRLAYPFVFWATNQEMEKYIEIPWNTSTDGLNIQYCNTIQPKDGFTSNGIPELGWYLSASSIRPGWKIAQMHSKIISYEICVSLAWILIYIYI